MLRKREGNETERENMQLMPFRTEAHPSAILTTRKHLEAFFF